MHQNEEHHYKNCAHLWLSNTARKLGFRLYDMYYVERSLHKPLPKFEPGIPLNLERATDDDQREIISSRGLRHERRLKFRFDSKRTICYVAKSGDDLVGYSMLSTGLMDITGLDAIELPIRQMPANTGLTHDAYVFPEFRGNRIFHTLLGHVYRDRKKAGLVRVSNLIDPANVWSLKVHLDLGNRIQRTRFLKFPGTGLITVGHGFVIGLLDT